MNVNAFFLKSFRILLLPFALLYGCIIILRNWFYDKGLFKSATFNLPIICVGNLSVGGTGKSPMTEYLIELLSNDYKLTTISRGYKRKTKGYVLANATTTALEIGDEPMQFHLKYPNISVGVGEERIVAIPQLLHDRPETEVIILDDAFQHRAVKAGLNILLTAYDDLFTHDFFLPTGNLRDQRASYKRADIIVVTKCPGTLAEVEKKQIADDIHLQEGQQLFFTGIEYGRPYHIINKTVKKVESNDEVLLVCGIANPKPLKEYLQQRTAAYYEMNYSDHHIFSIDDLQDIKKKYEEVTATNKYIITTEKDAVRLFKFSEALQQLPLYVIPIRHRFLFNEGNAFDTTVLQFVKQWKQDVVE